MGSGQSLPRQNQSRRQQVVLHVQSAPNLATTSARLRPISASSSLDYDISISSERSTSETTRDFEIEVQSGGASDIDNLISRLQHERSVESQTADPKQTQMSKSSRKRASIANPEMPQQSLVFDRKNSAPNFSQGSISPSDTLKLISQQIRLQDAQSLVKQNADVLPLLLFNDFCEITYMNDAGHSFFQATIQAMSKAQQAIAALQLEQLLLPDAYSKVKKAMVAIRTSKPDGSACLSGMTERGEDFQMKVRMVRNQDNRWTGSQRIFFVAFMWPFGKGLQRRDSMLSLSSASSQDQGLGFLYVNREKENIGNLVNGFRRRKSWQPTSDFEMPMQ